VLDEPTLGLQPNLVEEMGRTLNQVGKDGGSIILADENIDLVTEFAERVYFIENGKVALEGKTEEVLRNDYVRKVYLGME